MRKILIKYFALSYIARVGGRTITWLRAANVIFPLACANGIFAAKANLYLFESGLGIVLLVLFLASIFFGFGYFKIKPIEMWNDMDHMSIEQQYMFYKLTVGRAPTSVELYMERNYFNRRWKNVGLLAINLVVFIATVILGLTL